jgi:hypothetical protein
MGDVHGFPGDQEPFVTGRELADLMRVLPKTILRWRAAGLPCEDWGVRMYRYQVSRSVAWARGRGR